MLSFSHTVWWFNVISCCTNHQIMVWSWFAWKTKVFRFGYNDKLLAPTQKWWIQPSPKLWRKVVYKHCSWVSCLSQATVYCDNQQLPIPGKESASQKMWQCLLSKFGCLPSYASLWRNLFLTRDYCVTWDKAKWMCLQGIQLGGLGPRE